jgi:hypothetical protein
VDYDLGSTPGGLAVGDFNRDGKPDVVVTNQATNSVSVLLGDGEGSFTGTSRRFPTGSHPTAVAVGDLKGDGKPDLVTLNDNGTVSVLLGNGDGTFQAPRDIAIGGNLSALAVGDLRHNGRLDLVVTDYISNTVEVLLGNGDGSFQNARSYSVGTYPNAVTVGDLNGDNFPDLVVTDKNDDAVSVLLGNGDGTFQNATPYVAGPGPGGVALGDLNGDGKLDLVVSNTDSNSVSVLLGNGDGSFQSPQSYPVGTRPGAVVVGYFNDDAQLDVAVANKFDDSVSVLLGNGDGSLQPAQTYGTGSYPIGLAVSDVNRDGANDLITANAYSNNLSLLLNQEIPQAQRTALSAPSTLVAGTRTPLTVSALSAFGMATSSFRDTIQFTSTDGRAVFYDGTTPLPGSSYTFTYADRGMHAFNVVLCSAGPQTITVTDTANPSLNPPPAVVSVVPGAVTTLALSVLPSSLTAGSAGTVTVAAQDGCGNTVPGYRGTVRFTSSDTSATLPTPNPYTFTPDDNGVHPFPNGVIFRTAGNQWLRATDTANASVTGSTTVAVIADVASDLSLALNPATLTAGVGSTLTVTARDRFGNTASSYRGTVSFTKSDPAALPPNPNPYTFTPADNGVHLFNGVTFKTAGVQWIRATDTADPSLTGIVTFTVIAGPASTLVVPIPSTVALSAPINITVTALDSYGNKATTYQGTVHFSSSDPRAVLPGNYPFTTGDQGSHTFSIIPGTLGSQSITVADIANPSISATTSFSVVAIAGVVTKLVISGIPPIIPVYDDTGTDLSFTVTAKDYYDNTITSYRGSVQFGASRGVSLDTLYYTFTAADNGSQVFSGYSGPGNQSIGVWDISNSTISGSVGFRVVIHSCVHFCGGGGGGGQDNSPRQPRSWPANHWENTELPHAVVRSPRVDGEVFLDPHVFPAHHRENATHYLAMVQPHIGDIGGLLDRERPIADFDRVTTRAVPAPLDKAQSEHFFANTRWEDQRIALSGTRREVVSLADDSWEDVVQTVCGLSRKTFAGA